MFLVVVSEENVEVSLWLWRMNGTLFYIKVGIFLPALLVSSLLLFRSGGRLLRGIEVVQDASAVFSEGVICVLQMIVLLWGFVVFGPLETIAPGILGIAISTGADGRSRHI